MDLTHRFTVPVPVETTWEAFNDIASVAECFPGASVTSAEGDSFQGSCKVKLGPIALVYNGSGTFVEKDETAHRFVVDAKGKDKRGNGTAGAKVTLTMDATDGAATDVVVVTDLAVTGKPAQFGRGVMQDVSDKLLGQFVQCLEDRLSASGDEPEQAKPEPAVPDPDASVTPIGDAAGRAAAAAQSPPAESPIPEPHPARPPADTDDALDLGATVLPVLLKSYWRQGAAGLGVLLCLVWLVRRRS